MNLPRFLSACAAVGLIAQAGANGFTDQELALRAVLDTRAPLALSGDGAWRLHVDSHDVLHRARLADPADESSVQLPPGVQAMAASASGQKVVLATGPQCVGLADFGTHAGDAIKVTWLSTVDDIARRRGWQATKAEDCGVEWPAAPVAISSDGARIATPDAVIDTTTAEIVASLPADSSGTLRLAFVAQDTRLLVARATLGQRSEGPSAASGLSFSVWDLASKALVDDVEVTDTRLAAEASLLLDVSAQTGALFYVDERRRDRALPTAATPLELVQLAPDTCDAAPRTRLQVGDEVGGSFVVDPWGRWFAWSRPLDATRDAAELAGGVASELVVQDLATGRQLARVTSKYALHGLVVAPDGATLVALAAQQIDVELGTPRAGWPAVPDAEQLLEMKLPDAAIRAPRDAIRPSTAGVCREPGEAPGARAMARADHLLAPLWSRDLSTDKASAAPSRPSTHDRNATPDLDPCGDPDPATFTTPDGGIGLDLGAQVARLDPRTGAIAQWLPTPRRKNVCSVVAPAGNGFFSASGDTLTWRPLAAAADPSRRRVVEKRPGWIASVTAAKDGIERVLWIAAPETTVPLNDGGEPQNLVVADYDSNGKRLRESTANSAAYDDDRGDAYGHSSRLPAPCHDLHGTPLAIGDDWRGGPFGSQRGLTCGPLPGVGRLVWWSDATIAPRAHVEPSRTRPQPAIDGAIAVVADDTQLHVVNLALQREIAQIDLADRPVGNDSRAWVIASRKLVLVELTTGDGHRWLRAYALP